MVGLCPLPFAPFFRLRPLLIRSGSPDLRALAVEEEGSCLAAPIAVLAARMLLIVASLPVRAVGCGLAYWQRRGPSYLPGRTMGWAAERVLAPRSSTIYNCRVSSGPLVGLLQFCGLRRFLLWSYNAAQSMWQQTSYQCLPQICSCIQPSVSICAFLQLNHYDTTTM